jgi:hypothetical protein
MRRGALLIAVLLVSCKKEPPKGDLPPATDWGSAAPSGSAEPSSPHGGPLAGKPQPGPVDPTSAMPDDSTHAGLSGNPHGGVVPEKTAPKTPDKLPEGALALGPFAMTPPADWTVVPTTSSMRAAQFKLPGKPGAEAELVVTYFGPDGAGSIDDNVDRWVGQIQQPDGKSSHDAAKIEKTKFGGQDATYVSASGRYVAPAMPGASENVDKQDQALLAAIVSSPSGPYYFKLVGAKSTIDANAAKFRAMLSSIKVR